MIEGLLELILSIVFEFVLEIAGQLLLELGLRSLGETLMSREDRSPIFAGVGYGLLGLIAGGLSLLIFPNAFATSERFHGISLLITPVLAGLFMAGVGWLRERRGQETIRLESFLYGYIFALPMAIVRFLYTS